MGCPITSTLNQNLTFTVQSQLGDGTHINATGNVAYSVLDSESNVLLTGNMTLLQTETGLYSATIATSEANGFAVNSSYTINISATISGVAATKTYPFLCVSADFSDENTVYCVLADIQDVFGQSNINKWADLDNDGDSTKIIDRINRGIAWATEEINSKLRRSKYAIPLTDNDGEVPTIIVDIAANLAGVWMYENRGVQDFNPETGAKFHRLEYNRKRAFASISEILSGVKTLDAVIRTTTEIPQAVKCYRHHHEHDNFHTHGGHCI
jgi:hypothetical protein